MNRAALRRPESIVVTKTELKYGNCDTCRFTRPIPKGHRQREFYLRWCVRFPPHPGDSRYILTQNTPVNDDHGCFEHKPREAES